MGRGRSGVRTREAPIRPAESTTPDQIAAMVESRQREPIDVTS